MCFWKEISCIDSGLLEDTGLDRGSLWGPTPKKSLEKFGLEWKAKGRRLYGSNKIMCTLTEGNAGRDIRRQTDRHGHTPTPGQTVGDVRERAPRAQRHPPPDGERHRGTAHTGAPPPPKQAEI